MQEKPTTMMMLNVIQFVITERWKIFFCVFVSLIKWMFFDIFAKFLCAGIISQSNRNSLILCNILYESCFESEILFLQQICAKENTRKSSLYLRSQHFLCFFVCKAKFFFLVYYEYYLKHWTLYLIFILYLKEEPTWIFVINNVESYCLVSE
jgi:hypothetical protein